NALPEHPQMEHQRFPLCFCASPLCSTERRTPLSSPDCPAGKFHPDNRQCSLFAPLPPLLAPPSETQANRGKSERRRTAPKSLPESGKTAADTWPISPFSSIPETSHRKGTSVTGPFHVVS